MRKGRPITCDISCAQFIEVELKARPPTSSSPTVHKFAFLNTGDGLMFLIVNIAECFPTLLFISRSGECTSDPNLIVSSCSPSPSSVGVELKMPLPSKPPQGKKGDKISAEQSCPAANRSHKYGPWTSVNQDSELFHWKYQFYNNRTSYLKNKDNSSIYSSIQNN